MSVGLGGVVDDTGLHVVVAGGRRGNGHLPRPLSPTDVDYVLLEFLATFNNTLKSNVSCVSF